MNSLQLSHVGLALALVVLLTSGCRSSTDPVLYAKFQTAQTAFDSAETPDDFRRNAAMYQEILDAGFVSGAVLYNQGNAFMRAGMRGRAVACYLQARRYRPHDPYLEANLRSAFGGTTPPTSRPIVEYILFWQDWISYPAKFQLSTLCAGLTFVVAVCGLWWREKWLRWLSGAVLAVTVVLVLSAIYDWYRFSHVRQGVVVTADVVARKGNGESYEPAFNQPLDEATEFIVVDDRGDWILARVAADKEGWIRREAAVIF